MIDKVVKLLQKGVKKGKEGCHFKSDVKDGAESEDDSLVELFTIVPYDLGGFDTSFYAKDVV